ncbi:MAG TPA: DUF3373 family protein, partial [Ramlibacter sp.]|nr:DUF3373 family protein [Ramlibacter sp.]
MSKRMLCVLVAAAAAPVAVHAADDDVLRRIEALSKEIEQLKKQVAANGQQAQKVEQLQQEVSRAKDKSLGNWLTVGGDYRFRLDSLRGETRPFTDAAATFANAQNKLQSDFFANPTGLSTYFGAPQAGGLTTSQAISGLMAFAQGMNGVRSYTDAVAFMGTPQNRGMLQGLGAFAAFVPAYKPQNDTLYTNRLRLDLHAKATQDVSVTTRLAMYKTFGAGDDAAITNSGAAPFFADRVGVFDGTIGHVPSSDFVNVDRAYATWSNIGDRDMWFSVGRRPSTNGAPSNLRLNEPNPGNG